MGVFALHPSVRRSYDIKVIGVSSKSLEDFHFLQKHTRRKLLSQSLPFTGVPQCDRVNPYSCRYMYHLVGFGCAHSPGIREPAKSMFNTRLLLT